MTKPHYELTPIELGERLKTARETANMTQDAAAKAVGIARTTLVAIEKGQRNARLDEIRHLAAAMAYLPTCCYERKLFTWTLSLASVRFRTPTR